MVSSKQHCSIYLVVYVKSLIIFRMYGGDNRVYIEQAVLPTMRITFSMKCAKDVKIVLFKLKMPFLSKLEPIRIGTELATLQARPATTIFYRTLSSHTFSTSQGINRVISILIVLKRIVLSYTLHFSYLLKHTVYWKWRSKGKTTATRGLLITFPGA